MMMVLPAFLLRACLTDLGDLVCRGLLIILLSKVPSTTGSRGATAWQPLLMG